MIENTRAPSAGKGLVLDLTGLVPLKVMGTGTASSSTVLLGNRTWGSVPAGALGAHHTTHESGGADAIKLDDLKQPDDNTDLNASTSAHGLLPKLDNVSTHFLDGTGAWSTPTASVPDMNVISRQSNGNQTVNAGYGALIPSDYEIESGDIVELASDGVLEVT